LPVAFSAAVGDAAPVGQGPLVAYQPGERTLLSIPLPMLDRLYFWYVEAVRFPTEAVAITGNSVAEAVVSLERQGKRLLVRDRSPAFSTRTRRRAAKREGYRHAGRIGWPSMRALAACCSGHRDQAVNLSLAIGHQGGAAQVRRPPSPMPRWRTAT